MKRGFARHVLSFAEQLARVRLSACTMTLLIRLAFEQGIDQFCECVGGNSPFSLLPLMKKVGVALTPNFSAAWSCTLAILL